MTHSDEPLLTLYETESTSKQSVKVNPVLLNETETTRRSLETMIVENPDNPSAVIKIVIRHERRKKNGFEVEELPDLRKLKAGQSLSCKLDSSETLALFNELSSQYQLAGVVGPGKNQYLKISERGTPPKKLSKKEEGVFVELFKNFSNSPPAVREQLVQLSPSSFIENIHRSQLFEKKRKGIEVFKTMLGQECSEQKWQKFFENQDWIFGGMHDIQYLSKLVSQPRCSAANVQGRGETRADFLVCTRGRACFTVVVEIKKASTPLLKQYRDDVHCPSDDLNGGLAQLRMYVNKWQIKGSQMEENKNFEREGIYTVQPRGILIIGNLDEVKEDDRKLAAFELFRRNQKDIDIITYDEVFARAEQLLDMDREVLNNAK